MLTWLCSNVCLIYDMDLHMGSTPLAQYMDIHVHPQILVFLPPNLQYVALH